MKKYNYLYLCFIALFFSCNPESSFIQLDSTPVIVHQEPLPPFPRDLMREIWKLETRMLISEKGNVIEVEFLNSSVNGAWDSLAKERLKKWIFTPAILQNTPIRVWIKQPIRITIKEPLYLNLIEIVFENAEIAFKIYDSLLSGTNFYEMINEYSVSTSKRDHGKLGSVNIRDLDPSLQEHFELLAHDNFTKPIIYKGRYTIFKRVKDVN